MPVTQPGIGGAPVHVAVLQVEHPARRGEVGGDGGVRVQHALGEAGGAAGEVQQRVVLGIGPHRLEIRRGILEQFREVERALGQFAGAGGAHDQHVPELGQLGADRRHLAPVKKVGGHQHAHRAERQPCLHGLRPEGREHRAVHRAGRKRAEHGRVQGRDAAHERRDALATLHAQGREHVRNASRIGRELAVSAGPRGRVLGEEADRHAVGGRTLRVPEHGLVRDVERTAGETREQLAGAIPVMSATGLVVVGEIRGPQQGFRGLGDG
jgi:hypothetical protein